MQVQCCPMATTLQSKVYKISMDCSLLFCPSEIISSTHTNSYASYAPVKKISMTRLLNLQLSHDDDASVKSVFVGNKFVAKNLGSVPI